MTGLALRYDPTMMPAAFHLQDVERLVQSGRCKGRAGTSRERAPVEVKVKAQAGLHIVGYKLYATCVCIYMAYI